MPINDFIGFASSGSANIASQADYAAAAEQGIGMQPGPASSSLANKVWRQGANMAAALGQIVVGAGYDALDNGDIAELTKSLKSSFWDQDVWTPLINGSSTAGVISQTYTTTKYIKSGPVVTCFAIGSLGANVSATGQAILQPSSLPFVPAANVMLGIAFYNSTQYSMFYTNDRIYFRDVSGQSNLVCASITNAQDLRMAFIYYTNQ